MRIQTGYLKKNIEKQFTLEYLLVNQVNIMHWNLSENWKILQKKNTLLLQLGEQKTYSFVPNCRGWGVSNCKFCEKKSSTSFNYYERMT